MLFLCPKYDILRSSMIYYTGKAAHNCPGLYYTQDQADNLYKYIMINFVIYDDNHNEVLAHH